MRILDRYLARRLLLGWLGATLLLAVVFSLFAFTEELDRSSAGYDTLQVSRYVLLSAPGLSMSLLPITVLLGSIFAIATLARHNELIAMHNAAVSPARLLRSTAGPALLIMLLLWPVNEYLVAPLQQYAETARQTARSGSPVTLPDGGVWAVLDRRFHHVGRLDETLMPIDIAVYDFDAGNRLNQSLHAPRARITAGSEGFWRLEQVVSKQAPASGPDPDRLLATAYQEHREIPGAWSRQELFNLTLPHTAMPLTDLYGRIQLMRAGGQVADRMEHVFWQRALLPVLVAAMVLLGTQLSAGMTDARSHSLGRQLGLGVAASLIFYIVSQIIYASGLLLGLHAWVVASLPILAALFVCFVLGWRRHQTGPAGGSLTAH